MSEQIEMLSDAVERLFGDADGSAARAEQEGWQGALWEQLEDLGIPLVLVTESADGVGGDWDDAYAVLHAAGRHAIPLPVGEAMLAARMAERAGLPLPGGSASIATDCAGTLAIDEGGARFGGTLRRVPWGRDVTTVTAVLEVDGTHHVIRLRTDAAESTAHAANLAGEPRDTLVFRDARVETATCSAPEAAMLADIASLLRTAQAVGAMEASLHRTIAYATERKQFGRPIGKFQAVQQQLALFGSETAAAACAARTACHALGTIGTDAAFAICSAKLRANRAIGVATGAAHQVHAAIGFTHEYPLRHHTQRLWSWRSEHGNDQVWSERLGAMVAERGAEHFWSDLTARDDRAGAPQ
ncbi:acyl-CoA dehydrogenase family protein [Algiphilus sp.]|uniref:acyl-CoA dehydrogenase family protein n=1 Tax=Algiphilus sp. TaxID=1872431 RepID=UPI003C428084